MTSPQPDLYAILGLTPQATPEQISHAYRALARRYHPDTRAPTDPARSARSDTNLQRLLAAYAVLGDPARRADYDHHHATGQPPRRATPGPFRVTVRITRASPPGRHLRARLLLTQSANVALGRFDHPSRRG